MNIKLKIVVMSLLGGLGFAIWSAMAFFDSSMRADYAKFVISIVVGVVSLALRDMQPPGAGEAQTPTTPPGGAATQPDPAPQPPAAAP